MAEEVQTKRYVHNERMTVETPEGPREVLVAQVTVEALPEAWGPLDLDRFCHEIALHLACARMAREGAPMRTVGADEVLDLPVAQKESDR